MNRFDREAVKANDASKSRERFQKEAAAFKRYAEVLRNLAKKAK